MRGHRWVLLASTLAAAAAAGADTDTTRAIGYGTPIARPEFGRPRQMLLADVTGDGKDDIVAVSGVASRVTVFPGRGDGAFGAPFDLDTSAPPGAARAARLNADAAFDLVVDRADRGGLDVFLSDGRGGLALTTLPWSQTYGENGSCEYASTADWDGDGKLDLVSTDMQHVLRVRLGDGAGGFGAPQTTSLGSSDRGAALAADFDGDGRTDLAVADDAVRLAWRQADGSLSETDFLGWTGLGDARFKTFVAGDVDGNGLTDLVSLSWSTPARGASGAPGATVTVYRQIAPRSFAPKKQFGYQAITIPPTTLALADLNGDGRREIVTPHAVFVNHGDGAFGQAFKLPAMGTSFVVLDWTGDGRPDVLVAGDSDTPMAAPVVAASAAPPPTLTSISPSPVYVGARHDFTFACSGVSPAAVFDFGDGFQEPAQAVFATRDVQMLSVGDFTPTSFVVGLLVSPDATPGTRTVTAVNPDGASASMPYELVAGGDAQVFSMTPSRGRPGERLSVVVRGRDFVDGVRAAFFNHNPVGVSFEVLVGLVVTEIRFVSPDELRFVLDIDAAAEPGVRTLFITNGTGVLSFFRDRFTVLSPATIDLVARTGVLAPAVGRGAFTASGRLAFNDLSPDRAFDPLTETAEIRCGDMTNPVVVSIPAGDGWRIRVGRATWTSPRRASPRVRLVLDFDAETFRLDVSRFDLAPPSSNEVGVELTLGDETGASVSTWTRRPDGRLSLRPARRPRRAR